MQLVLHWRGISKDLIDDVLKIDEMQTRYNTRISHHGSSAISAPWRWRCFHSEARVRRLKGPLVGPRSGSKDGVRELTSEAQTGKMKVINCSMVCMACMFAIVCMVSVVITFHMYGMYGMYDRYDRCGMHGIIDMYGRYGIC